MSQSVIQQTFPLGLHWQTQDPFLFCAYHNDRYPRGNDQLGPNVPLTGRNIGQDFEGKDGFRMYHGEVVPGFPVHPHRGFETITLVRKGYVDHADSLGAAGRYGQGDVQWMTAGRGIQHSEMFPLLDKDQENPVELFQLWLNLPKSNKMTPPDYKMFWTKQVPIWEGDQGRVRVEVIAGDFFDVKALTPPSMSWAATLDHQVAVWLIQMNPKGQLTLPPAPASVNRMLYFYQGSQLDISGTSVASHQGMTLSSAHEVSLTNTGEKAWLLLLQGQPIQEPIANWGPFVMNTREEIMQAVNEYQQTQFGGWTWPRHDMVHGTEKRRFGRHANGKEEFPD